MSIVQTTTVHLSVPIITSNDVSKSKVTILGTPEQISADAYNGFIGGVIVSDSERAEMIDHPTSREILIPTNRVVAMLPAADAEYAG